MVLDALLDWKKAKQSPVAVLVLSALFVTFGVLANLLLPSIRGGAVIFAMIPAIPVFWKMFGKEEKGIQLELKAHHFSSFSYHKPLLIVLAAFFAGSTLAYALWFVALPSKAIFTDQINEIVALQSASGGVTGRLTLEGTLRGITGQVSTAVGELVSGRVFRQELFWRLFTHNLSVLTVMFLACLIYGIGSIYLLLWNASVIGAFVGQLVQARGPEWLILGFLGLFPHGAVEISAYLIASIAGGILSVSVDRGHIRQPYSKYVLLDVALLTMTSVFLIGLAAAIEAL